jgi:LysR family glycine cleavage system transcriptional activator
MATRGQINRRWLPLNALRAFEAVGQRLSFTAGANALSVSQSAVSRHVIGLEELLGKPLFEREAGGLSLTAAGAELLPVVSKSFERIEQTLNAIRDDRVGLRTLRIHVPPTLLQLRLLPMLGEFRQAHPEFQIDISSSNVTGLPAEQIDMAIVYDRPNVDDWVTDLLLPARVAPLCSPGTATRAAGQSLREFLANVELLHVKLDHQPRDLLWANYAQQQGLEIMTRGGLSFDTAVAAAAYAAAQDGVLLGEVEIFASEIAAGHLVMPFDTAAESGFGYYLKLHADDLADPVVAAFRTWLIARLGGAAK